MGRSFGWGAPLAAFSWSLLVGVAGGLGACSADDVGGAAPADERGAEDAGYRRDGSTYDSAPPPDSGLGELRFQPAQSYSGSDGVHAYKVPVAVYDGDEDVTVTPADPAAATVERVALTDPVDADGHVDDGKYFLVTVKKTGNVRLVASSRGRSVEATIAVAQYSPDAFAAGEARYTRGGGEDAPACSSCHGGVAGIDHSPAALATIDDEKVATVITTGMSTAGFPIRDVPGGHRWDVSSREQAGLVTYLRALPPRGFR